MAFSNIRFKKLDGEYDDTKFKCAQPLKNMFGSMLEYSYIMDEAAYREGKSRVAYTKWIEYLVEMGLPLKITKIKGDSVVAITDFSYVNSRNHLLWVHSLIRMHEEAHQDVSGTYFTEYLDYVYKLRELIPEDTLDNYQIFQMASYFENKVVDTSPTFTHMIFSNVEGTGLIIAKLSTHDQIVDRFLAVEGTLGLNGASAIYLHKRELYSTYGDDQSYTRNILNMVGGNKSKSMEYNIDKIFEYLARMEHKLQAVLVTTKDRGKHGTLIPGNLYKINAQNAQTVSITDGFGNYISMNKKNITMIN